MLPGPVAPDPAKASGVCIMPRRNAQAEHARTLEWGFSSFDVIVKLHQVDVETWREDERYNNPTWHVVPSHERGRLLVLRALLRPH
jgi:hypothetical protein